MPRSKKTPVLDEEKKSNVVALVAVGSSRRVAARYVGCAPSTIVRTAARDDKFAAELQKAACEAELGLLNSIRKAAKKEQHWRAAAWILERAHPERYASRSPEVITVAQIAQILAQFSRIVAEEVPVAAFRKRALARFAELYRNLTGRSPRWRSRGNEEERDAST